MSHVLIDRLVSERLLQNSHSVICTHVNALDNPGAEFLEGRGTSAAYADHMVTSLDVLLAELEPDTAVAAGYDDICH